MHVSDVKTNLHGFGVKTQEKALYFVYPAENASTLPLDLAVFIIFAKVFLVTFRPKHKGVCGRLHLQTGKGNEPRRKPTPRKP